MALTAEELGLIMPEAINGQTPQDIAQKGICACGHRVSKHRPGRWCAGVPIGRRKYATAEETDCRCRVAVPVITVADVRPFQASWLSSLPSHPFEYGLSRIGLSKVNAWLVETPLRCVNPDCPSGGGGVRMRYVPGTNRELSVFACEPCYQEMITYGGGA